MEPSANSSGKPDSPLRAVSRIWIYVLFEGGLALLGILFAWLAQFDALGRPSGREEAAFWAPLGWGLGIGVGCSGVMLILDRFSWRPIEELRNLVERALGELLRDASYLQIVVLSAAAGIGEEVLFRGFLQQGVGKLLGRMGYDAAFSQWTAILVASLIFGLLHALTKTYLVAATLFGLLFGYLYFYTDHILSPIVAHGVYDLIAIIFFVRFQKRRA